MRGERKFVVVMEVWNQVSADYDAAKTTETLIVKDGTTMAEIVAWYDAFNVLGRGDMVLSIGQEEASR